MPLAVNTLLERVRKIRDDMALPPVAREAARRDRSRGQLADAGIPATVGAAFDWLGVAQDRSASSDGGFARHFSLLTGWGASYPETSGYIVPTLLNGIPGRPNDVLIERARKALDWLVSIQLPSGAFQGGVIGQTPVVPVTFNTGQILIGLASGVAAFGEEYRPAMRAAASWLLATQDADGAWRDNPTPFADRGEKAYETHVAWGLLEAARLEPAAGYAESALRNIRWALTKQHENGWFEDCCLTDSARPLAHTVGYVLRGILEGYRYSGDPDLLSAAVLTADGVLHALDAQGFLPGRFNSDWTGAVPWACLTGSVQIAHCWLLLFQITGDERYRDAAYLANAYVRARVQVGGRPEVRGGVKGSFPLDGDYGRFEYLDWACKFFIDANLLEAEVRESAGERELADAMKSVPV